MMLAAKGEVASEGAGVTVDLKGDLTEIVRIIFLELWEKNAIVAGIVCILITTVPFYFIFTWGQIVRHKIQNKSVRDGTRFVKGATAASNKDVESTLTVGEKSE